MTNFLLLHKLVELQVWKRDLQVSAITQDDSCIGPVQPIPARLSILQWHVEQSRALNAIRNNIFANY